MTIQADLRLCPVAELEVEPGSVDLILTDPPYPREYLSTWSDLGAFAARALKPEGHLIAMSGHMFLPEVIARLGEHAIKYRWTIACMTPGANGRVFPVKIYQGWKPILWYTKSDAGTARPQVWIEDRIVSRPDKTFHHWGQDLSVFRSLTLKFSASRALVCDPFLGGGTTAVAAALYGRRFIGCDVDEACIEKTRARLSAVEDYLRSRRGDPVPEIA